jgi:DNA-binding response OmpR family regulator
MIDLYTYKKQMSEFEKPKLLIVDDEPDTVNTLETFFSLKGYSVFGAFNGKQALDILESEKIDSVLLDIKLPDMSGTEIARIIRDKYPSIKIIVLTGYLQRPEDLMEYGLEDVFIKPVKLHELYNRLSEKITPLDSSVVDPKHKEGIKARVLMIKAKILLIEQSYEVFKFLSTHFKELAQKGENYEFEVAGNEEEIVSKLSFFNPDLILLNAAILKEYSERLLQISSKNISIKEIIMYNIRDISSFSYQELQKLTKTVETACFKNGLIDIKWIEI